MKLHKSHNPKNLDRLFNKGKQVYGIRFEENEVLTEMRKDKKFARLLRRNKRITSGMNRGGGASSKLGSTSRLS
jgi:hypothetical protein